MQVATSRASPTDKNSSKVLRALASTASSFSGPAGALQRGARQV
jgi:hypothetical protein